MTNEEINELDSAYLEDNDASYAEFGYYFQADAGVYLFLKHFYDVDSVKIESRLQDIELKKKDGNLILAQAKSSQNPKNINDEKSKLKDALYSLIKNNNNKSDILIYVSNLDDPLKTGEFNEFHEKEINYEFFSKTGKENVETVIANLKKQLEEKINDPKTKDFVVKKSIKILKHLDEFDRTNFYVLSIPKYYADNKEIIIVNSISEFLYTQLNFDVYLCDRIAKKMYNIWHSMFFNNSTNPADCNKKELHKDAIVWPIVTETNNSYSLYDLNEIIDETFDDVTVEKVKNYSENYFIKHHNFPVVNDILINYSEYTKIKRNQPELMFVKDNWQSYCDEFTYVEADVRKYVTMMFMYCIIKNYRNVTKVLKRGDVI